MVTPRQLGHLVINVRNLDVSEKFYTELMGLKVTNSNPGKMIFMIANDDISHELALVSVGESALKPESSYVRLAHMAWQMDSLNDLREIYQLLKHTGTEIKGIGDHGMSLGIYFSDPDGNEIEVYLQRFLTNRELKVDSAKYRHFMQRFIILIVFGKERDQF